jgi:hypothetical protein
MGSEVCGAVIDRQSGWGSVTITGKGYATITITTGPQETGDRYIDQGVKEKQTCMIKGGAVLLYYRRRKEKSPAIPKGPQNQQQHALLSRDMITSQASNSTPPVDIVVRLQKDGKGRFSSLYDKSVLRPKVTIAEFFSWFAKQTGYGGMEGPSLLKFTFKDAMPVPKATEIARGNEDHFSYMRRDIKEQSEKARTFMPDLKEFVVLVTAPGWGSPPGLEEEEW